MKVGQIIDAGTPNTCCGAKILRSLKAGLTVVDHSVARHPPVTAPGLAR
jgi:hypothetical protein